MNIPEEIYIHILKITTFKTSDLKSLKLSCWLFNKIVNERIVLVITSIAKWKSHDWSYEKIYSTQRIILVLSLPDYVTNEKADFMERLLKRRLKGTLKFEVWFTDVEKAITLPNWKQEKAITLPNWKQDKTTCEHVKANLEKRDYLRCNNYVLHNQCCVDHKSYTNILSYILNGDTQNYCSNHNVPYLSTSQPNSWLKTKCDLLSLFKASCWNTTKLLINGIRYNLRPKKVE